MRRKKNKNKFNTNLLTHETPFQYKEAFSFLRTNIKFLSADSDCKKIVITSAIPDEGKSSVAVNLSLSLSAAKGTVLLIDADLRKPTLHNYLSVKDGNVLGLTNCIGEKRVLNDCIRKQLFKKNLYFLPCGVIPPNPAELLGSRRMKETLDAVNHYDYVIMDTPPVTVVSDAAILSQYADGVLLVIRQKKSTFEQVQKAKDSLEKVNAKILGVVINDFNFKHLDEDSSYYYTNYS